jgi:hypothetical protein
MSRALAMNGNHIESSDLYQRGYG